MRTIRLSDSPLKILCLPLGPLETNCYLVSPQGCQDALIVDPADSPEAILSVLKQEGLRAGAVVLTHGHCDHIAGAAAFAGQGIPIMIHSADAEMLGDPMQSGAALFGLPQNNCQATRLLQEGDVIDLWGGISPLRVIHTPGHSPGAICLLAEGCAFVGDLLFAGGIGRTDLPGGNDEAMIRSLQRLLELPDSTIIYPGHGPATTIGIERESNPFLGGSFGTGFMG